MNTETFDYKTAMRHFADGKRVQFRRRDIHTWDTILESDGSIAFFNSWEYRLTPERKKIPLCKEDFDGHPIVWIRNQDGDYELMVSAISKSGIWLLTSQAKVPWQHLMDMKDKYSFNRKDWFDCFKYEGEG